MEIKTKLNQKKNLLFLSSRVPYPLVGGDKIRVFNTLTILSQKYEVDLLYIDNESITKSTEEVLKKYCSQIKCFVISKKQHYLSTLLGFIRNTKPLQVNYYYDKEIQNWINHNIDNYDAVFCNLIRTTEYVRPFSLPKYVDFVDSIAMNYEKAYTKSSGIWKLIYKVEKIRVKNYEKIIAKEFDKKFIISQVDRSYIDKENKLDIQVIGNFVPNISVDKNIQVKDYQFCFLGKMDYEPNISAVVYFVEKIFPKVKQKYPNTIFKIIGANPTKRVRELERTEGVIVTGFVENPYIFVQESMLFVAPMVSGAGVQNKILEAMSMGKCVVTTPIGAEGLDNLTGGELVACESDTDFCDKICYLLTDKIEVENIGIKAREYINRYYSQERLTTIFLNFLSFTK